MWLSLAAAFVGALVGGVASAWGGHLSTRADRIRDTRVEIYRECLPKMRSGLAPRVTNATMPTYQRAMTAARTCRRTDQRWANRLDGALESYVYFQDETVRVAVLNPESGEHEVPEELERLFRKAEYELSSVLSMWNDWLVKKL